MARSTCRFALLLIGAVSLTLSACGSPEPDSGSAAVETPAAPAVEADTRSTIAWSGQAEQTAAAPTPEDIAAQSAAAGRAMAETCGFTDAEMRQFKTREDAARQSAGFEARVETHLPRLRQVQQAQQRENSEAYQAGCELMRFMMDKRG